MDLPLALKVLIIALQILFVGRLLGKACVQLLQVLPPAVYGSFALQLGLLQSGYFVKESLLLLFPDTDLCPSNGIKKVRESQLVPPLFIGDDCPDDEDRTSHALTFAKFLFLDGLVVSRHGHAEKLLLRIGPLAL